MRNNIFGRLCIEDFEIDIFCVCQLEDIKINIFKLLSKDFLTDYYQMPIALFIFVLQVYLKVLYYNVYKNFLDMNILQTILK